MKNKKNFSIFSSLFLSALLLIFSACSDADFDFDTENSNVDNKTNLGINLNVLLLKIDEARNINSNTYVSYYDGTDVLQGEFWVTKEEKTALDTAIDSADNILKKPVSQSVVDGAVTALTEAITVFNAARKPGKMTNIPVNVIQLVSNSWVHGEIENNGDFQWYSVNVTEKTEYYFWWNKRDNGDGTKTLEIDVYAYNENYEWFFLSFSNNNAWNGHVKYTAAYTGMVYLKVRARSIDNPIGTYSIVYSTYSNRPAGGSDNTVSFNNSGGNGTVPSITAHSGNAIILPGGYGLTKGDYFFVGWTDPNGNIYSAGSSYTVTKDVTLYARWGSEALGGDVNPIPLAPGEWVNGEITGNTTNKELYYSFNVTEGAVYYIWWNEKGNDNGDGTKTLDIDVNVYLKGMILNSFSGRSAAWNSPQSFTASSTGTVKLKVTPSLFSNNSIGTFAIAYNTSLTYNVIFNNNLGSGTVTTIMAAPGSVIKLPDGSGIKRNGYLFSCWNTRQTGYGTDYSVGADYTVTGNVILYVKWVNSYTVTFDLNGGSGVVPAPVSGVYGTIITIPGGDGLSKSGYAFYGWNNTTTGEIYRNGFPYTIKENVTMRAYWINYTVTFNVNGGIGQAPSSVTNIPGASITLPNGDGFTKSGYAFGGWNTNADGSGTNYNAGADYIINNNITLYAKWNFIYTIIFDVYNGNGTIPSITAASGTSITIPSGEGLSREGFVFGGWENRGSGKEYKAGDSFTVSGNITFIAIWRYIYTVTFNNNGGSGTVSSISAGSGSAINLPDGSELSKNGYTFGGWTNVNGTILYNSGSSYTVNSNVTMYAKWNGSFNVDGTRENPIPLTLCEWKDGEITNSTANGEVWYSFNAVQGDRYYVWWDENGCDNGKTLNVKVEAYNSDGSVIFNENTAWDTPCLFLAKSTGMIKLRVFPYSSTGTFAIVYSVGKLRPGSIGTVETNPIPLTVGNVWKNGEINSNVSGANELWYSFDVTTYTKYNIWLNSANQGDGSKSLYIEVDAKYSTGESIFTGETYLWNTPQSFTSNRNGTVLIKVTATDVRSGAFFGIACSTFSTRPPRTGNGTYEDPYPLRRNWTNSEIPPYSDSVYFSIDATAGTTYYIWWNDAKNGDGTKTVDIMVGADDNGWSSPRQITADKNGLLRIQVTPYSPNATGTFAIAYGTSATPRPSN